MGPESVLGRGVAFGAVALAAVALADIAFLEADTFVKVEVEVDGDPFEWGKGIDSVDESEEEEELLFWRLMLEIAAMALCGAFSEELDPRE